MYVESHIYLFVTSVTVCSIQLYTDRTKVLKTEAERELWQSIDFNYMTEESDCDEDGELAIRRYLLPWRSKSQFV